MIRASIAIAPCSDAPPGLRLSRLRRRTEIVLAHFFRGSFGFSSIPSCCIHPRTSAFSLTSTTLPFLMRAIHTPLQSDVLPVGRRPLILPFVRSLEREPNNDMLPRGDHFLDVPMSVRESSPDYHRLLPTGPPPTAPPATLPRVPTRRGGRDDPAQAGRWLARPALLTRLERLLQDREERRQQERKANKQQ
jgi:hypothetical protein